MINRRGFVKLLATIPIGLAYTPLIGEAAGGLAVSVPAPENLADYLELWPPNRSVNQDRWCVRATLIMAIAPLGATRASYHMYGGTMAFHTQTQAQGCTAADFAPMFAEAWEQDHYPGWVRVLSGGTWTNGEPPRKHWIRAGWIRFMRPGEAIGRDLAVA